jgi:hypothetical protein
VSKVVFAQALRIGLSQKLHRLRHRSLATRGNQPRTIWVKGTSQKSLLTRLLWDAGVNPRYVEHFREVYFGKQPSARRESDSALKESLRTWSSPAPVQSYSYVPSSQRTKRFIMCRHSENLTGAQKPAIPHSAISESIPTRGLPSSPSASSAVRNVSPANSHKPSTNIRRPHSIRGLTPLGIRNTGCMSARRAVHGSRPVEWCDLPSPCRSVVSA